MKDGVMNDGIQSTSMTDMLVAREDFSEYLFGEKISTIHRLPLSEVSGLLRSSWRVCVCVVGV